MKIATATTALVLGLTPITAQAGELWISFRACLSDALTAETMILPLAKPQPGQTTLSVRCRGASAAKLFDLMAKPGRPGSAADSDTRSAEAVQCFRFTGPPVSHECMITIGVGAAFLDAL